MKSKLDVVLKITILAAVLVISLSVAYYLVIFLPAKEARRLEVEKNDIENKKEIQNKEYINKRKDDCYEKYLKEKKQWNNVEDYWYGERSDKCFVLYKDTKPQRSQDECSKILASSVNATDNFTRDLVSISYIECSNHTFSKMF